MFCSAILQMVFQVDYSIILVCSWEEASTAFTYSTILTERLKLFWYKSYYYHSQFNPNWVTLSKTLTSTFLCLPSEHKPGSCFIIFYHQCVPKLWSANHLFQGHWAASLKCSLSGPTIFLVNQILWRWDLQIFILNKLPEWFPMCIKACKLLT